MTKITRLNDTCDEHWSKVNRLATDLAKLAEQAGCGKLIAVECAYIRERCENIVASNARHRAGYTHSADTNILDEVGLISKTLQSRDFQPSAQPWLAAMRACVGGIMLAVQARSSSEAAREAESPVTVALRRAA